LNSFAYLFRAICFSSIWYYHPTYRGVHGIGAGPQGYAGLPLEYPFRKLEQQQSRFAGNARQRNTMVGRVARDVVSRVLRDTGIATTCEETSPTEWRHDCLATLEGVFLQVRFIGDRPNYTNLLEDLQSSNYRHHDFYIATTSRDEVETIEIVGYATRDELERLKPRGFGQGAFNRRVRLARLHPFDELVVEINSRAQAARRPRVMN
jgi:hypothetical protein